MTVVDVAGVAALVWLLCIGWLAWAVRHATEVGPGHPEFRKYDP